MNLSVPPLKISSIGTIGASALNVSSLCTPIPPSGNRPDYNSIACEYSLLSADQIITRWIGDRHSLARSVSNTGLPNPWNRVVSRDDTCICCLGTNGKAFASSMACTGCTVISRLFRDGEIIQDSPFTIQVGRYIGNKYVISNLRKGLDIGYGLTGYIRSSQPLAVGSQILEELSEMQACETSFSAHVRNTVFWASKGSHVENYIVISSFLENELRKGGLPTGPTFRWVFECAGNVNIVEEVPTLLRGTLAEVVSTSDYIEFPKSPTARTSPVSPLTSDVARGLLLQLISTLHFLNRYAFTHGAPSIHSLGFSRTPAAFIYDECKISSPVGLRLIPSGFSSLSASGLDAEIIRIYHPGMLLDQSVDYRLLPKISVTSFIGIRDPALSKSSSKRSHPSKSVSTTEDTPSLESRTTIAPHDTVPETTTCVVGSEVGATATTACTVASDGATATTACTVASDGATATPCLPEYIKMRIVGYKIGDNPTSFTSYVRHLGIPLFHSSFDVYAFWVALMCEEPFFQAVHADSELLRIWLHLWNASEYLAMMQQLQILRERRANQASPSFETLVQFLSDFHLRCDALDNTWRLLKALNS